MLNAKYLAAAAAGCLALIASACSTAPKTTSERASLMRQADSTLEVMRAESTAFGDLLDRSHGYAVFPSIGKGGAFVGGAYGRGIVYEQGQPVGYVELNQASLGLQLGGQTFSEVILFETPAALEQLKGGSWSLGAGASAIVLTTGAGGRLDFRGGVAVVVKPKGGLMFDVSVSGQKLNFEQMGAAR